MEVFDDISKVPKDKKTILTLGTFDGIHLGHIKIIEKIKEEALLYGGRSFLITFNPHPKNVISQGTKKVSLLTTVREKINILNSLGIQNLLVINFTKEFSQQPAEDFLKNYIIDKIGISKIIVGYDHHFGKGRGGNIETLKQMGNEFDFKVSEVDAFSLEGENISSTKIREVLKLGDIKLANKFLGRYYSFSGTVVEGDKRGRTLGFPTANIELENPDKLLPALGIYVVEFFVNNKKHFGLLSVGKRPTFYDEGKIIPEVFIYDFDKDIYGEFVTVNVIERIRGEEKFSSIEELIKKMNEDKEVGLSILSNLVE